MQKFTDQVGKRYNFMHILKHAICGFEFEFFSKHSYYKTLEELNMLLAPIKVHGFRKYHSDFKVDDKNFKIEPDWSGGPSCVELITGPLDYASARVILLKILNWLKNNATTDERCSIHINLSFDKEELNLKNLKILKTILNIDEDYIYTLFPDRKGNVYAKTVKKIVPFKDYDFSEISPSIVETGIQLPDTRYHGVNLTHINSNRIEYRYIGGENYHTKVIEIMQLLDYFIIVTHDAIVEAYDTDDMMTLRRMMDKNINHYKSLSKLEDFISAYPDVTLQVDKTDDWHLVTAYYHDIFIELFELVSNLNTLKRCIINWDTSRNRLEVVEAEIVANYTLDRYDFINCVIKNTSLQDCETISCEIEQSHLMNVSVKDTEVKTSKVIDCNVNKHSHLVDCFFMGGKIEGEMEGGVLRSGQVSKDAIIASSVEVLTSNNFFNAEISNIAHKEMGKGGKKVVSGIKAKR